MSKPETWKSWEGRVVDGKFPLRQWLGGTDNSAVFLTERAGTKAAIKLMESEGSDADRELARLRAAAKLSHPNLISSFEVGRSRIDGTNVAYVVMEFAEEDLSQILPQRPLTAAEVSEMLPPLLDALSYLHEKGFVHGRIKPSNVLAVGDQLKLSTDQAIAAGEATSIRRRVGVFDAPEVASGNISAASDVWSLGVTITAALTQKPTPAAEGAQEDPELPQGIPEPFAGIARECLHIDPKRRCSIADIRARLQPAARSVPAEEPKPASGTPRKRGPFVGIATIVAALLVVFGVLHFRGKSSPAQDEPATTQSTPRAAPAAAPQVTPTPAPTTPSAHAPAVHEPAPAPKKTSAAGGEVTHQVIPEIPQSAKNTITGTIKVAVHVEVDAAGKVTSAKFKSAGPSKYFAGQALKAAQGWTFDPPQVDGQPVASAWLLQFRFKRGSTQASPSRITH